MEKLDVICRGGLKFSIFGWVVEDRSWAAELYKLMVKRKQTMDKNLGILDDHPTKSGVKPIDILKVKLAKGEITKGEYEELRKMVA